MKKASIIIHSRTYNNDFIPGFLVRPEYFGSTEIDWARKYIRAATSDIDLMSGERYVVVDNGKFRIAGIVTIIENLGSKIKSDSNIKQYYCDQKNRNIYAFIGVCIQKTSTPLCIDLTYDDFANIFEKYVGAVWNDLSVETKLIGDEFVFTTIPSCNKTSENGFKFANSNIYESNPNVDREWFKYYLNCQEVDFSFCSNISKYATLKNSVFSILTTVPNNIKRLGMDNSVIKFNQQEEDEKEYQEFKKKYYERLLSEFSAQILSDKNKNLDDKEKAYKELLEDTYLFKKFADEVQNKIYKGEIDETYNYRFEKWSSWKLQLNLNKDCVFVIKKIIEEK